MPDDPVHDGILRKEGDDLHFPALMKAMSTARLPHRGQIKGSTSQTFRIIPAQPFDGMGLGSFADKKRQDLMRRLRFMRAKPERGLPQSR